MNINTLTQLALFTTIALSIFIVELKIPNLVPIPGVKLGLANIVTVYVVYHYRGKEVMLLVLTRVFLAAFFTGQIVSLVYSLAGSLLCLAGLLLMRPIIAEKYLWICSILSAILHNIGQVLVAIMITGTIAIVVYLPLLIAAGCIAGCCTGICAQVIINRSRRMKLNTNTLE